MTRFHLDEKILDDSFVRLAKATIVDAMYSVDKKGNVLDMFWLVSDEAKTYLEVAEIDREKIVQFVVKAMLGARKQLPKKIG